MIQDRKIIAENGETVLKGLDEALKFVRLESDRTFSKLGDGQTFADKEMGYDENNGVVHFKCSRKFPKNLLN